MKKAVLFSILFWTLAAGILGGVPFLILSEESLPTPELIITHPISPVDEEFALIPTIPTEEPPPDPVITELTLSFVGDCMLATHVGGEWQGSFNLLAKQVEPSYFFENFAEIFKNDTWTIANLENVFTDNPRARTRPKGYTPAYWYKSTTANTAILTEGGVDVVSLSNNHSGDYGDIGYADTRTALEEAGILWGDNDNMVILEQDGFRIAIYCATFYYSYNDETVAEALANVDADYKIAYLHGGTERVHVPDSWKAAGFRRLIDNGVDLVIGHHPHVLQPIEIYKGKTIIHSLGNFVFGGSRNEENRTIVYQLKITLTDGEVTEISDHIIPCYVYTDMYQPAIITNQAEIDALMAFLRGETESPMGG